MPAQLKGTKIILLVITLMAGQLTSSCCRQSFTYPVLADVERIEIMTEGATTTKEITDAATIDTIVRFIDERRSRWCSPWSGPPTPSATLNFHLARGGTGKIGLGKGFLVSEFPTGKYLLKLSTDEQQEFFKLLGIDESHVFKPASRSNNRMS